MRGTNVQNAGVPNVANTQDSQEQAPCATHWFLGLIQIPHEALVSIVGLRERVGFNTIGGGFDTVGGGFNTIGGGFTCEPADGVQVNGEAAIGVGAAGEEVVEHSPCATVISQMPQLPQRAVHKLLVLGDSIGLLYSAGEEARGGQEGVGRGSQASGPALVEGLRVLARLEDEEPGVELARALHPERRARTHTHSGYTGGPQGVHRGLLIRDGYGVVEQARPDLFILCFAAFLFSSMSAIQ
eukprot:1194077-Prorocentrum_minimum.AAC.2